MFNLSLVEQTVNATCILGRLYLINNMLVAKALLFVHRNSWPYCLRSLEEVFKRNCIGYLAYMISIKMEL